MYHSATTFWPQLFMAKIFATDFYAMSLYKVSVRGVLARSQISIQGLLARLLYEISRFAQASTVEMHMDMSQTVILF